MVLGPWFNKKIIDPLLQILQRGAEPKQLAFSTALGLTLGVFPICVVSRALGLPLGVGALGITIVFPVCGVTVFLCGMAIALLKFRCHAPSLMLANFIATPIELSLVLPFLRFGETLTGGPHFPLTSDALKRVLTGKASREVLLSVAHALMGWLVAAPFILLILYIVFVPVFKILIQKFSPVPVSPKKPQHSHSDIRLKIYSDAAIKDCSDHASGTATCSSPTDTDDDS